MKVCIFTCLMLFAAAVFAQEVTPPGGNGEDGEGSGFVTSCYNGSVTYNNSNPIVNQTLVACNIGDGLPGACQTKIEVRMNSTGDVIFRSVIRVCTTMEACMNQAAGNRPTKCYPGENGVRLCFFCCNTHRCNNFETIPDEEVIGA